MGEKYNPFIKNYNTYLRAKKAYLIRLTSAQSLMEFPYADQLSNRDEYLYPKKIGNYSKGLPHNNLGEVYLFAYHKFLAALKTGQTEDFSTIPLGGNLKLVNPQASYVFDLLGPDCSQLGIKTPPAFNSAWAASEMAELYWQSYTRDVHFEEYDSNPLTLLAAEDLSGFSDFRGQKNKGKVTTGTLFRGDTPGDLTGPYISQFLWKDIPFGATTFPQFYRSIVAGSDHMTSYQDWLEIQNGFSTGRPLTDPVPRYIRNGRDLGEYVHLDFTYQCTLSACLILQSFGKGAISPFNPYLSSPTEGGFVTFGPAHILDLITKASWAALESA